MVLQAVQAPLLIFYKMLCENMNPFTKVRREVGHVCMLCINQGVVNMCTMSLKKILAYPLFGTRLWLCSC